MSVIGWRRIMLNLHKAGAVAVCLMATSLALKEKEKE
jgi:hypothetical protein